MQCLEPWGATHAQLLAVPEATQMLWDSRACTCWGQQACRSFMLNVIEAGLSTFARLLSVSRSRRNSPSASIPLATFSCRTLISLACSCTVQSQVRPGVCCAASCWR